MIGLKAISSYIPSMTRDNFALAKQFGKSEEFVIQRLGGHVLPLMEEGMETSDMAVKALTRLLNETGLDKKEIDCLVLCTQNPDGRGLPHTSAIVQKKAGLSVSVAAFDISLGCSGYVYGLNIVKGFMEASGLRTGVLITADPYSKIIDENDMNTVMLFGDAATATLITDDPLFSFGESVFSTHGEGASDLKNEDGVLYMNGRNVFNFVATEVVQQIENLLRIANLSKEDIDCYVLHQGSKYIVETLSRRLDIQNKVICSMEKTGNTVSSSIPLILQKTIMQNRNNKILISGFGVGFSIGTMIIERSTTN